MSQQRPGARPIARAATRRAERVTGAALAALAALVALATLLLAPTASGDDRDLLRESIGEPYVFIIFDTSGSMNWSTRCTQAQIDAGDCDFLCDTRDCHVPLNGDDPSSKFYQAKEALYDVISQIDDVSFGFATYNQDDLAVRGKHWLYRRDDASPTLSFDSGTDFPAFGATQVFGRIFDCTSGDDTGFTANAAADMTDPWEAERVHRCPQMGQDGTVNSSATNDNLIYVEDGGETYRIEYRSLGSQTLGASTFRVQMRLYLCNNNSCNDFDQIDTANVDFTLLDEFLMWDAGDNRNAPRNGFFNQGDASDSLANGTCEGWDPNDDTNADRVNGSYNLRFPTFLHPNPAWRPHLDEGDVLPLSWETNNKDEILRRLAPNHLVEPVPDFSISRYFEDELSSGRLDLEDSDERPILPSGATPLGFAVADFRTWWAGCQQGSCSGDTGWSDLAAAADPDWACRKKFLLVISDGDDTCPGRDPCSFTASLRAQENIKTYVVAFGVQNTPGNRLTCMASNGGTGSPVFPQNKAELVDALTDIFGEIREEARSFASAAVPSVQAEVADKIFFSSFTPLNDTSSWDGHLDAFVKPLPLTVDNLPDDSPAAACSGPTDSNCHLWDAGEEILAQAPTAAQVQAGVFKLGSSENERRVYYPFAADTSTVPNDRRLFLPTSNADERRDLWDGMGLNYLPLVDPTSNDSSPGTPLGITRAVINRTLEIKSADLEDADGNTITIQYVLGDIFHSNPVAIDNPESFRLFAADAFGDGSACADGNPGYRCFAQKHRLRRKMLAAGGNDGMLHIFDIGTYNSSDERFENGGGKEIFAFMPRMVLPIVKEIACRNATCSEPGTRQIYAVDSTPRIVDVFIDPAHSPADPLDDDDREWRTVLIGGLREGGLKQGNRRVRLDNGKPFSSGYYALDITQPDRLNSVFAPINQNVVPTCLTSYSPSDCGPVPFGAELWEFTDSIGGSPSEFGLAFDEDENNAPDLGDSWSIPVMGRIRVLDDAGDPEDRWVAIFGGGFDPESPANPRRGTWIYMVDIETGKTLYKQPVDGAVPSTVAAVDKNQDTVIDTVYFGTTAGFLYKIDLSVPVEVDDTFTAKDILGTPHLNLERITDELWEPFKIFDTLENGQRKPIFFPPAVLFLSRIDQFALAFGTGDREKLWTFDGNEGRFYIIVDENFARGDTDLPQTEDDYETLDSEEPASSPDADFVLNPGSGNSRGWVMTLDPDERLVAAPFSVAGVTIFPTFKPQVVNLSSGEEVICARTGDSRVFVIFSNNANPILPSEDGGEGDRSMTVGEALVTPPYAEQRATSNDPSDTPPNPDKLEWEKQIRESLEDLFPENTRFANYTIDVSFIRSDRGVVGPIPIPIGIVQKNWKEF